MTKKFDETDYISCQDRINRFWKEWPGGSILTEVVHGVNFDTVIVRAEVYQVREDVRPSATGIAAEERGADYRSGANFTSWHENAETSAIGRALANMGYATSQHDRMTREEVGKVNRGNAAVAAPDAPQRTEAPRKPSTSTNTAPDVPVASGRPASWSAFWKAVRDAGLPGDKKALEGMIGSSLPHDPGFAFEIVQAWRKDNPAQAVLQ